MADLIYSIRRVFTEYLSDNKKYNVPEYQRGYKWTENQIHQLLNDINGFETAGNDDLFYCLQNITLVHKDKTNLINIVDGQQRLTTIALILSYLGKNDIVEDKIIYAVRETSNNFMQRVIRNENNFISNTIIKSNDFDDFLKNNKEDYDFQDIYFMYSALKACNDWFLANKEIKKDIFLFKFLDNVKIIVNRVDHVVEQELFMNLNAGQVHLDGSDLIRAILVTRVAKDEMEFYNPDEIQDLVRLNERRIRIGWELDDINAWWSQSDVKEYYSNFTKLNTGTNETIKFDEKSYPINLLYKIWAESQGKKDIRLCYFEAKNSKAMDLYVKILHMHRALKDWYSDREIYHYLGFLFNQSRIKFKDIWDLWETNNKTRNDFKRELIDYIDKSFSDTDEKNKEDSDENRLSVWYANILNTDGDSAINWYETDITQKILLLIDVIIHSKNAVIPLGNPVPFLHPAYFRNVNEDLEHIYPCTPTEFKKIKNIENPVQKINYYIKNLNEELSETNLIENWDISEKEWKEMSENEKNSKLSDLKLEIHKKYPINSIGNLVLLHLSINRGFGNNNYSSKREVVIMNTEKGFYVRQHTLKVFVKQTFESNDLNKWTKYDIIENVENLSNMISEFFELTSEENNNEE